MSMKNSNNIIGNRTRDLPACSAVPPPFAPPRAPLYFLLFILTVCNCSISEAQTSELGATLTLLTSGGSSSVLPCHRVMCTFYCDNIHVKYKITAPCLTKFFLISFGEGSD